MIQRDTYGRTDGGDPGGYPPTSHYLFELIRRYRAQGQSFDEALASARTIVETARKSAS